MGNTWYMGWEPALMGNLQKSLGADIIGLISHLSFFGEAVFLIIVVGFFYWGYDKACGIALGHCVLLNNVLCTMVKNVFLRRRPYFDHEGVDIYRPVEPAADIYDVSAQGYSFPSGHSSNSAALAGSLAWQVKREGLDGSHNVLLQRILTVLAFAVPFLVGLSRVVVGAHYPTDVLCGFLLGVILIFLVPVLRAKLGEEKYCVLAAIVPALGIFFCKSDDFYSSLGLLWGFLAARAFDGHFVNFRGTKNVPRILLRMTCGLAIFLAANTLIKLPFPAEFRDSETMAAMLFRTVRYTVSVFLVMGIYPSAFGRIGFFNRLFEEKAGRS